MKEAMIRGRRALIATVPLTVGALTVALAAPALAVETSAEVPLSPDQVAAMAVHAADSAGAAVEAVPVRETAVGLTTGTGDVTAPTSSRGDISLSGPASEAEPYTFSLPHEAGGGVAAQAKDDTIVYGASAASNAALAVRLGDGVAQQIIAIKDASASHEYTFRIDDRLTPARRSDGSITLTAKDQADAGDAPSLNATVAPAWARDANDKPVPTHYEIRDGSVIQVVDFTTATAFPVTADPTYYYWWGPRYVATWAQTKQTKAWADSGNYDYGPVFCALLGVAAGVACGVLLTAGINAISNQARYAVAHHKCLYEDVPYVGAPRIYTGTCPGASGGGGV